MKNWTCLLVIASSVIVSGGQSASAGITTFFNSGLYQNAINLTNASEQRTDTFEGFSNGPVGSIINNSGSLTTSGPTLTSTYGITSNIQFAVDNSVTPTRTLGINDIIEPDITENLTIGFNKNLRGIGFELLTDDTIGGVLGDFVVTVQSQLGSNFTTTEVFATSAISTPLPNNYRSYFFGFVGDTANDYILRVSVNTTSALNAFRLDNVATAVPEPTSMALVGCALAFGALRRRGRSLRS